MEFRIAATFTESFARLTPQEQQAVQDVVLDIHRNPAILDLGFYHQDPFQGPHFLPVRITDTIQMLVHRTDANLLLIYVDHQAPAHGWGEKRQIQRHPTTGAAQLVVLPEVTTKAAPVTKPAILAHLSTNDLLRNGVPLAWLDSVRSANEETLLEIADHLPQEAAQALLTLAAGNTPEPAPILPTDGDPFDHPDAQQRFRVVANVAELQQALEYPWEQWIVFLHSSQRRLVERDYAGPARVAGSAGTGKTIVALHRAVHLARKNPQSRVLLTTFAEPLARALKHKLGCLVGYEPEIGQRIVVAALAGIGRDLYAEAHGEPNIVAPDTLARLLEETAAPHKFTSRFLFSEWSEVVDAWQLTSWEAYRDVPRLGRKTRISGKQRELLWSLFAKVQEELARRQLVTWPQMFARVTKMLASRTDPLFDFAVVDEAQDLGVAELRFLAGLGGARANALFFAGDLGQRIFHPPFSWKALGVDVRGRSQTLRVNYRTSHQIRQMADRLLPSSLSDVDGNQESRTGTVSVFNGPLPTIKILPDPQQEALAVAAWIQDLLQHGCQPHEIAIFVRDLPQLERARQTIKISGCQAVELGDNMATEIGHLSMATMHLAKGLEFRAVVVMACDDEIIPLQERIATVTDESDLEEVYNTERHLLYVACTRARDHLLITGVAPASEFLDDLRDTRA